MRENLRSWWNWQRVALVALGLLVVIVGVFLGYRYTPRDTGPIPAQIRQELTFSPFVIADSVNDYTVSDYKFSTAEDKVQILSYQVETNDGHRVTISQHNQSQEFTEIPEYKDRFLTNVAQQYDSVQMSNGTIYLGRSTRQNNQQLAVMLERGLIVFMSPDKDLDKTQWRNLGDQLEIQKVIN